jgi:predicted Zn-dependent protease
VFAVLETKNRERVIEKFRAYGGTVFSTTLLPGVVARPKRSHRLTSASVMNERSWQHQRPTTRRGAAVAYLGCLCVAGALLSIPACNVSQRQEQTLGAADAAQVDSQLPLIHDTIITRYVATLGRSMASHTSRADLDWHFAVVNSSEVNAFALPGGFIYVNRGAIEQADREDELAGIMGHEIGHVVRRHSVQQLQKRERGDVALVVLCTLTRACGTISGRVAIDVGANALTARYSQHDEAEADSEGVLNTRRVGIDPEGLPSFFQKLLDMQKQSPTAVEAFFSTHPTDESRVAATRRQIASLPPVTGAPLRRDTPEFHAIQQRVRALPAPPAPTTQSTNDSRADSTVARRRPR